MRGPLNCVHTQPNTPARGDSNNAYASHGTSQDRYVDYTGYSSDSADRLHRRQQPSLNSTQRASDSQQSSPLDRQQQLSRYSRDLAPPVNDRLGSAVCTLQNTYTDTQMHQTGYGNVLTIRTTTVTRTITERLVRSDEDESSGDDDGDARQVGQPQDGAYTGR
ncbi:hypothetical protein ABL78_6370 [Leptomonas seymouri]|uniref:Uncharacterized protein n=1 Tax=Leptomonas seymouri TaxID=5684 RepID=A0A0N1PAE8_LEPSE|nr:hypothetical protein ABL78_6370 [Leptomonas seymouri]|eukprot:KPI84580.1 hypothetical protein ABL78_6370 [Leptomonas seymouri]